MAPIFNQEHIISHNLSFEEKNLVLITQNAGRHNLSKIDGDQFTYGPSTRTKKNKIASNEPAFQTTKPIIVMTTLWC